MDLLASYQIEELPEQQTRTLHLFSQFPEFSARLGFDACCTCGTLLSPGGEIKCSACHRVSYCSEACRAQDASSTAMATATTPGGGEGGAEGEEDQAVGHSSVICAVLKLCKLDEAIDTDRTTTTMLSSDLPAMNATIERVKSEYQSYPATLANIIQNGPCFQAVLQKCSYGGGERGNCLTIHVVGASEDAELEGYSFLDGSNPNQDNNNNNSHSSKEKKQQAIWDDYAEAFGEMVESRRFDAVELYFVGPDCPKHQNIAETRRISSSAKGGGGNRDSGQAKELRIRTCCGEYTTPFLQQESIPAPDIVVFFNPGFTCPDYEWIQTLRSIQNGTPFLVTTNTELEGIADCQYLCDNDLITAVPPGLADVLDMKDSRSRHMEEEEDDNGPFFDVNPFSGSRVRQSSTMANDLYVKNRWMLGGIFDRQGSQPQHKKKKREGNTKSNNPALI